MQNGACPIRRPDLPDRARISPAARLRRVLTSALVLPFVLISALAAGTMPNRGFEGIEMVICFGDGLAVITIGPDGWPVDDGAPAPADCPWDHAAPAAVIEAGIGTAATPTSLRPVRFAATMPATDIRARIRQVPNRGPPATV